MTTRMFRNQLMGLWMLIAIASCNPQSKGQYSTPVAHRNYDSLLALRTIPAIDRKLSNPDASPEAKALYKYLLATYGKKTLSGQMWVPWSMDEIKYIEKKTGKLPAIRGADLITQRDNEREIKNMIDWWKSGGISTIMWHWGGPGIGEGYENSKGTVEIDNCFKEGTPEYKAFWSELKTKADLLEKVRDANVPVLWRPYHEFSGHWFWYSKEGSAQFKKLWITMYDYFVHERKLNNLIWVLCYADYPSAEWFPGDAYVDIAGADTYKGKEEPHLDMFNHVQKIVANNPMPVCYHECGILPDPDRCFDEGAMWLWWMEWHTNYLEDLDEDYLHHIYNHELIITKDELPDIMKVYGE